MAYELWEAATANMIGDYPTENAALGAVRAEIDVHGRGYVDTLVLVHEEQRGRSRTIAPGPALADRALESIPA
jgi:hypothetical protein